MEKREIKGLGKVTLGKCIVSAIEGWTEGTHESVSNVTVFLFLGVLRCRQA
jgi:hypothetical protein